MAILGYDTNGSLEDGTGGWRVASFTTSTEVGTISSYSAYVRCSAGNDTLYLGLYADNGSNEPGTRLEVVSQAISQNTGAATLQTIIGASYVFAASTKYWLAAAVGDGSTSGFKVKYNTGGGTNQFSANGGNALPDPFGTIGYSDTWIASIYATYSASSAAVTGPFPTFRPDLP